MAEQKESSVLFSLKELMSLEEDRLKQEDTDRQRAAQAEAQSRADQERRTRDEQEARMRAEEERRRTEEQRQREETARVEAIRHAEVERARLDAENAARLEAMKHHQEHERHLTAIKEKTGKKQVVMIAVGVAALLVVALVGGGFGIKALLDRNAAEASAHQRELAAKTEELGKLQRELNEQNAAVAQLEDAVKNAKDEASKEAAQKALQAAQQRQAETSKAIKTRGVPGGPAPIKPSTPRPACNCQPGDPLCSCIQ
jgi:colicin import membrane protein